MAVAGIPTAHGEIAGSTTAKQLPDIAVAGTVILKGLASNAGNVYLGLSSAVTVAAGTQDITSGFEIAASAKIELSVTNLNSLFIICDNAGDDLSYLIIGG
tara:strand:- start:2632 stop:2934 length:303 start_codon:yes stop_codon:yes gene_type:complete